MPLCHTTRMEPFNKRHLSLLAQAMLAMAAMALLIVTGCATAPHAGSRQRYEELLAAAQDGINAGRPDSALIPLKEAIQLSEADFRVHLLTGVAYEMLRDYKAAIDALLVARSLAPEVKEIPFDLGNNYFALQQYSAAVDSYSGAIRVDPTFAKPYLNRANALINLREVHEALLDYQRYQTLIPSPRADVALMISRLEAYEATHPAAAP